MSKSSSYDRQPGEGKAEHMERVRSEAKRQFIHNYDPSR